MKNLSIYLNDEIKKQISDQINTNTEIYVKNPKGKNQREDFTLIQGKL